MYREFKKRLKTIENRLALLEEGHGLNGETASKLPNILELDLTLPEADIGGLHFNKQKVHAVFDRKEDGWWHSRDILFLSARNNEDNNRRDILTEYLNHIVDGKATESISGQITYALNCYGSKIEIALPEENEGVKKYNGVNCWYWLKSPYSGSASYFCFVGNLGYSNYATASAVGGCAPAFCVA